MTLSKEKTEEMMLAAKPLIKWIAENCHPHCFATVDCASVDLAECVANEATKEFLGDRYAIVCPNCGEKTALSVGPSAAACRVCMHSWELPKNMKEDRHASDCATHNGPALPEGPCDCGVYGPGSRMMKCTRCGKLKNVNEFSTPDLCNECRP